MACVRKRLDGGLDFLSVTSIFEAKSKAGDDAKCHGKDAIIKTISYGIDSKREKDLSLYDKNCRVTDPFLCCNESKIRGQKISNSWSVMRNKDKIRL